MNLGGLDQALEEAYGLRVAGIEVVASTEQKLLLAVVDEAGVRYGLKRRPPWITVSDFDAVCRLQRQAATAGARIPAVIATREGTLVWRRDGNDLSLYAWVDGVPLGWNLDHARGLGVAVGAFAQATADLHAPQAGDWAFPKGRERWLPDTPAQLRATSRFLDGVDSARSAVAEIQAIVLKAERATETNDLPTGFIHGDISPLNAVWADGEATLIDLDEMRWGYRLFDAAQGAAIIAGMDAGDDRANVRSHWDTARLNAFLEGWVREVRPSPVERAAFPFLLQLVLVRVTIGELDLDDPVLPTRPHAATATDALLTLLREPPPELP